MTGATVHWDRRFTHYDEREGAVTAHFEDDSTAQGDVLVDADGVHSTVRVQLLSDRADCRPKPVPLGGIPGELKADKEHH